MNRTPASAQAGFSLIELMITVAIIGILAAIGTTNYDAMVQRARASSAKTTMAGIITGYAALTVDTGYNNFNGVEAVVTDCRMQVFCTDGTVLGWNGPYFQLDQPGGTCPGTTCPYNDPWGHEYYIDNDYSIPGPVVVPAVVSFGPDHLEEYPTGASDDVWIQIPNYVP